MASLPTVGGDSGTWGGILNTFLSVSLNSDGTLNTTAANNAGAVTLVPTAVKTSAYAANPTNFIPVDVSGGSVTITLPSAPTNLTTIAVKLINASGSNVVTINRSGSDVFNKAGGSTSLTLSLLNQSVILQYAASPSIWYVNSGDLGQSSTSQNYAFMGPTSGSGAPTFRAIVAGDIPTLNQNTTGSAGSVTGLSVVSGKTFTVNNSITLAGTDGQTMTLPSTSATIARTDAAQTFTGAQTFASIIDSNNAVTVASSAATVPVTYRLTTVTNNTAASVTITIATASATDGQLLIVRFYDFSAAAQTIAWINTENSTVGVPVTSNGSTTLPLTIGFQYNGKTSKWRCIALA